MDSHQGFNGVRLAGLCLAITVLLTACITEDGAPPTASLGKTDNSTLPAPATVPPTSLTISPPKYLAFAANLIGNVDLYLIDLANAKPQILTLNPASEYHLAWSPDGTRIAFDRAENGTFATYVARAGDSSSASKLTDGCCPTWSPMNTRLALVSPSGNGFAVRIVDLNGATLKDFASATPLELQPSWSPVGNNIAFLGTHDGSDLAKVFQYNFDLYVAAADTQSAIEATHNMDLMLSKPAWSPDGTQIAVVGQAGGDPDIYLVSVEGMTGQNLTADAKEDTDPQWSPDGDRIAFVSNRGGNDDIYIMKSDGTDVLPLTSTSARDASPRWSPDGKQIAFVEYVFDTANIYLIMADGSERQLVLSLQVNPDPPIELAWQP